MRPVRGLVLGACVATLLAGCHAPLTRDGTAYTYSYAHGEVTITASSSTGGNEREIYWSPYTQATMNSTVCADWISGKGLTQDGFAWRVTDGHGVIHALTITRNVYMRAFWFMNFHSWDTNRRRPFRLIHQTSLLSYLGSRPEFPLWACGRETGQLLQFIVWENGTKRPAWGSTTQGGEVRIPASFGDTPGVTGFYIGHIRPGTSAVVGSLRIDGKPVGASLVRAN
ncbi:MAG: hypothetical protein ACLPYW_01620 [Acidimicrobiales bacterium]